MAGPYRDADGTQCLKCAALLVTDGHGDLVCPEGCGTWIPRAGVFQLVGEVKLESVGKIAFWKVDPFEPTRCLVCKAPLADLYAQLGQGALALGQCVDHGVWLQRATREHFERAYAHLIEQKRPAPAPTRFEVPSRVELLEQRIAALEQRVGELEAIVRGRG